jgi:methylated-DNA-[protein]-cysteine S-methyltransferase
MIHTTVESPIGALLLTGDGTALSGLYTAQHVRPPLEIGDRDDTAFVQARRELAEYFDGVRNTFDVALAPVGSPFQQRVWSELRQIAYGRTVSYSDIAERIGNPRSVRAVGMANGRNPISIVVPCHRVIGRSGALTGYAGGLDAKEWLLKHEAANS